MTTYIITKQNADGSYDEVGMRNRTLITGYKTMAGALRYGIEPFARGCIARVEIFRGSVYGNISDIRFYNFVN